MHRLLNVLGVAASAFSESKSFAAAEACATLNQVLLFCPVIWYLGLVLFLLHQAETK